MFYIIPTPIGNLDDITKRSINVIESLDFLFCENVNHTKMMFEKLVMLMTNLHSNIFKQ